MLENEIFDNETFDNNFIIGDEQMKIHECGSKVISFDGYASSATSLGSLEVLEITESSSICFKKKNIIEHTMSDGAPIIDLVVPDMGCFIRMFDPTAPTIMRLTLTEGYVGKEEKSLIIFSDETSASKYVIGISKDAFVRRTFDGAWEFLMLPGENLLVVAKDEAIAKDALLTSFQTLYNSLLAN